MNCHVKGSCVAPSAYTAACVVPSSRPVAEHRVAERNEPIGTMFHVEQEGEQ